jgi:pSer/pThr/pTyr-binding forkhead associated (FHA) protein
MNERESALALFRDACGLSAPLALECRAASGSAVASVTHAFECPFALIGRDRKSDLILDHAEISRRHTFVQAVAGHVLVFDLQSRTKVFWEGEDAPRSKGSLDENRFIQVGPYRIRRIGRNPGLDQQAAAIDGSVPSDQAPNEAGSVARAALELPIRMGDSPSLWPLGERVVLVGRGAECDLVLTDESASRFHAALVPTRAGVWVVDLLAREGTHVNGERVRWAWLADGDSFRMGSFTFILRYETPPDQITRRDVPLEFGASVAQQPGTELAVRVAKPRNDRQALTLRPGSRSEVRLKAAGFSQALEPPQLVPSGAAAWGPSISFPPNSMAIWQQQMQLMESFHNDMLLMVQMFVAMHRDHLASVRHELDMVQRLTGELSDLQAKLAEGPSSPSVGLTAGRGRPSRGPDPAQSLDHMKQNKRPVSRKPTIDSRPADPTSPQSAAEPGPIRRKSNSTERSMPAGPAGISKGEDSQIHALLTTRIAELQRERQGYWQRILSALHN